MSLCFYYDIVNTVHGCVRKCIPVKKHSEHSIVGWNENVKHYHVIARSEFKFWKQNNMPRSMVSHWGHNCIFDASRS